MNEHSFVWRVRFGEVIPSHHVELQIWDEDRKVHPSAMVWYRFDNPRWFYGEIISAPSADVVRRVFQLAPITPALVADFIRRIAQQTGRPDAAQSLETRWFTAAMDGTLSRMGHSASELSQLIRGPMDMPGQE